MTILYLLRLFVHPVLGTRPFKSRLHSRVHPTLCCALCTCFRSLWPVSVLSGRLLFFSLIFSLSASILLRRWSPKTFTCAQDYAYSCLWGGVSRYRCAQKGVPRLSEWGEIHLLLSKWHMFCRGSSRSMWPILWIANHRSFNCFTIDIFLIRTGALTCHSETSDLSNPALNLGRYVYRWKADGVQYLFYLVLDVSRPYYDRSNGTIATARAAEQISWRPNLHFVCMIIDILHPQNLVKTK